MPFAQDTGSGSSSSSASSPIVDVVLGLEELYRFCESDQSAHADDVPPAFEALLRISESPGRGDAPAEDDSGSVGNEVGSGRSEGEEEDVRPEPVMLPSGELHQVMHLLHLTRYSPNDALVW